MVNARFFFQPETKTAKILIRILLWQKMPGEKVSLCSNFFCNSWPLFLKAKLPPSLTNGVRTQNSLFTYHFREWKQQCTQNMATSSMKKTIVRSFPDDMPNVCEDFPHWRRICHIQDKDDLHFVVWLMVQIGRNYWIEFCGKKVFLEWETQRFVNKNPRPFLRERNGHHFETTFLTPE